MTRETASSCSMSADRQGAPVRQGRPLLAAGFVGAAAFIILVLVAPLPGAFQAAVYLLFFSVLPGGALLVIVERTASSPLLTLVASVVISVAIVMTATMMMAYLEVWAPVVIVISIAVLSAVAGAVEFYRINTT